MSKLDDAIEALLAASKPAGCWGSHLSGEAAKFMAAAREAEAKGIKVSRTVARDLLREEFGVSIGEDAFRDHLLGRCSCE